VFRIRAFFFWHKILVIVYLHQKVGIMRFGIFLCLVLLFHPKCSEGFSVLSHEAVIDACWERSILPVLRKRFPDCSDEDLRLAKAYAYGGAIMPDMGYFPFGSIFFTDLVHYCCSGDFTEALLSEAQDVNEYAFALGALAHYNADNYGHPLAINCSVPMVYPKDRKKYGDTVTFVKDPIDHRRMEFGFDVLQVARGNYEHKNYNDFIGFEVSKQLMERAFLKTYGLSLQSVFTNLDLAIAAFRLSVKNLFPTLTQAAWVNKRDDIQKLYPEMTKKEYKYHLSQKEYKKTWKGTPLRVNFVAEVIRFMPKFFGNARVLRFRMPTPDAESLFNKCFDTVVTHYTISLQQILNGGITLENLDYDTGHPSRMGEYPLGDETYFKLLKKLSDDHFDHLTPEEETNILEFYGKPASTDKNSIAILYTTLKK